MSYSTYGKHVIVDAWGIEFNKLNDIDFLKAQMVEAIESSGATLLAVHSKAFTPNGATILMLLSESHFSIHTYPEEGYAAIDCYTCGERVEPKKAIESLLLTLQPKEISIRALVRGVKEGLHLSETNLRQ